jgi:hypothetical protein
VRGADDRIASAPPPASLGVFGGGRHLAAVGAPGMPARGQLLGAGIFSRDWRAAAKDLLSEQNLFGCQADDDLPYLLQYSGENNLVHGTDYGHLIA